jgi:hypothetical protein
VQRLVVVAAALAGLVRPAAAFAALRRTARSQSPARGGSRAVGERLTWQWPVVASDAVEIIAAVLAPGRRRFGNAHEEALP